MHIIASCHGCLASYMKTGPGPLLVEQILDRVHFWQSENWTGSTFGGAKTGPGPLLAERKLDRVHFWSTKTGLGPLLVEQKLDRVHFWRSENWTECIFHSDGSQQNHNCPYIVLRS